MSAITEKATLGQEITFTATLHRAKIGNARAWKPAPQKEQKGIVVGVRTLWDGNMEYEEGDEPDTIQSWFNPSGHVAAFLVAYALNRKPVLVAQSNAIASH